MTPATWSAEAAPGVRRALLTELAGLLDAAVTAREITWLSVYLDYCEEVGADDDDIGACEGCPIGGGVEACSGVWRWSGTHTLVTQAQREAQR